MTIIQPGSIVVATDGSIDAEQAVRWAAEQAALESRPLVVFSAAHQVPAMVGPWPGPTYVYPADDVLASARAIADNAMRSALAHRPGLAVETAVAELDPRTALTDLTARAGLLVLGSRGRGPVTSKLLGSVSAAVARHATCPVVVCRPGSGTSAAAGVLVGADGTTGSLPVLDFAFRQASLRSRPLTILHSFDDNVGAGGDPLLPQGSMSTLQAQRLAVAESVAELAQRYPDVRFDVAVAHGYAADVLAAVADRHSLVVIGHHPKDTVTDRITGSSATAVLERAHTNVAVVPEQSPW